MQAQLAFKSSIVVIALSLLTTGNAMAITNGNFSNGLSGWNMAGDVAVQSGAVIMTTASLGFQDDFPEAAGAFNASGHDAVSSSTLESFSGLTAGALDGNDFAYEGSALKQTFSVNAGDKLSFDWNFFTNEAANASPDFAFFSINGVLTKLASSANATNASVPYAFSTGKSTFSQTFTSAATVSLAFGVTDVTDYNVTSALWLDNVAVTSVAAVPEPTTYAMMLAGLGLLGAIAKQRRNLK